MRRTVVANRNQNAFEAKTGNIKQQIELLTTLTAALLGELEFLHSTTAAPQTDSADGSESSTGEGGRLDFHESRIDFYQEVERYEIYLIKRALKQASGSQRKAAQLLALNSTTLHSKIKHYGIQTLDVTAQYTSHLDGFYRLARARTALVAQKKAEPESAIAKLHDNVVKFQDFE